MNFTTIYTAVLHISAIASLVVLMATSHLDTTTGFPLLAGLLGFGAGVGVTPNTTTTTTPVPAATIVVPPVTPVP